MTIQTKAEYFRAMAQIEELVQKGLPNLSPDEENLFGQLAKAAEAWEINEYPMPLKPTIEELLGYLMRHLNLSQSAFAAQLDISAPMLSEILSGKKKPNLDLARQLHTKFNIDGNLILESI